MTVAVQSGQRGPCWGYCNLAACRTFVRAFCPDWDPFPAVDVAPSESLLTPPDGSGFQTCDGSCIPDFMAGVPCVSHAVEGVPLLDDPVDSPWFSPSLAQSGNCRACWQRVCTTDTPSDDIVPGAVVRKSFSYTFCLQFANIPDPDTGAPVPAVLMSLHFEGRIQVNFAVNGEGEVILLDGGEVFAGGCGYGLGATSAFIRDYFSRGNVFSYPHEQWVRLADWPCGGPWVLELGYTFGPGLGTLAPPGTGDIIDTCFTPWPATFTVGPAAGDPGPPTQTLDDCCIPGETTLPWLCRDGRCQQDAGGAFVSKAACESAGCAQPPAGGGQGGEVGGHVEVPCCSGLEIPKVLSFALAGIGAGVCTCLTFTATATWSESLRAWVVNTITPCGQFLLAYLYCRAAVDPGAADSTDFLVDMYCNGVPLFLARPANDVVCGPPFEAVVNSPAAIPAGPCCGDVGGTIVGIWVAVPGVVP